MTIGSTGHQFGRRSLGADQNRYLPELASELDRLGRRNAEYQDTRLWRPAPVTTDPVATEERVASTLDVRFQLLLAVLVLGVAEGNRGRIVGGNVGPGIYGMSLEKRIEVGAGVPDLDAQLTERSLGEKGRCAVRVPQTAAVRCLAQEVLASVPGYVSRREQVLVIVGYVSRSIVRCGIMRFALSPGG